MECVLQSESSRPSFSTHPWKIRLYCRVEMCWLVPILDRNKKSLLCKLLSCINAATASLFPLVISNCTGLPVFCCNTAARLETELNQAFYLPVQAGFGSPRYEISEVVFFDRWYSLCSSVTCSYLNLAMWEIWVWLSLMSKKQTLLTSRIINQRGAGQRSRVFFSQGLVNVHSSHGG